MIRLGKIQEKRYGEGGHPLLPCTPEGQRAVREDNCSHSFWNQIQKETVCLNSQQIFGDVSYIFAIDSSLSRGNRNNTRTCFIASTEIVMVGILYKDVDKLLPEESHALLDGYVEFRQ